MAREEVKPPRDLSNEHTLVAQRYAGYLVGHPYSNAQQTTNVTVEKRPWREPAVIADDCIFCERLTDEEAVRRVLGFQYQIDIECTRGKRRYVREWVASGASGASGPVVEFIVARDGDPLQPGLGLCPADLRRFCELFQDSQDWSPSPKPFPMVDLPLRLKRKMCIEWNHIYVAWMEKTGYEYDFEKRMFWREVPYAAPTPDEVHATPGWDNR